MIGHLFKAAVASYQHLKKAHPIAAQVAPKVPKVIKFVKMLWEK